MDIVSITEDKQLEDCDGYTDETTKKIVISKCDDNRSLGNKERNIKRVIRHEIIHAYMFESGLGNDFEHQENGQEELMVDWMARQFPKMLVTFTEANAI